MRPLDQGLETTVLLETLENEILFQMLWIQATVYCVVQIIQGFASLLRVILRGQPGKTAGIP